MHDWGVKPAMVRPMPGPDETAGLEFPVGVRPSAEYSARELRRNCDAIARVDGAGGGGARGQ